jgi:hypothetical protein
MRFVHVIRVVLIDLEVCLYQDSLFVFKSYSMANRGDTETVSSLLFDAPANQVEDSINSISAKPLLNLPLLLHIAADQRFLFFLRTIDTIFASPQRAPSPLVQLTLL